MGLQVVVIDRSTPLNISGTYRFDRASGGTLVAPAGMAFPDPAVPGEFFWRIDERKLYRRTDDGASWEVSPADMVDHGATHTDAGTDTIPLAVPAGASGLMSGSDKATLDSLSVGTVVIPVRNETGATLLKGRAVYVLAWDAPTKTALVAYADKDDPNRRPAVAILHSNVPNNTTSTAVLQGLVVGLDTHLYSLTDQMVLGNEGQLTRPPPDNVAFVSGSVQNMAIVARVHSSDGQVAVLVDGLDSVESEQVWALQGTSGTPSGTNRYVTNADARLSDDRTASGVRTATSVVTVSASPAPTAGQSLQATSGTAAAWQHLSDSSFGTNKLEWARLRGVGTQILEPAGFSSLTTATVTIVNGTRTLTVAPVSGSFSFWAAGSEITKSAPDSVVWAALEGSHYFYYDRAGVLRVTTDYAALEAILQGDGAFVATLYWDTTNNVAIFKGEERHRFMPQDVHLPWHLAFGARWVSGGSLSNITLGNGSSNADAQLAISDFRILDEDLIHTIANGAPQVLSPALQAPVFYRSGAQGYWRRKTADSYPFIQSGAAGFTGTSGRVAYNEWTGSTWQLSTAGQGNYVGIILFGTNDPAQGCVSILGQRQYTTVTDARAGILSELESITGLSNLFGPELVALAACLIQTSSTYSNTVRARFVAVDASGSPYLNLRGYKGGTAYAGSAVTFPSDTLVFGAQGVDISTTTRYLLPGGPGAIAPTVSPGIRTARAGTLRSLRIRHNALGSGGNVTYTVYVNGSATAITATVAADAQAGADTTNVVGVTVDSLVYIAVTKGAIITASPEYVTATLEFS